MSAGWLSGKGNGSGFGSSVDSALRLIDNQKCMSAPRRIESQIRLYSYRNKLHIKRPTAIGSLSGITKWTKELLQR